MEARATPPTNAVMLFSGQVLHDWQARAGGPPRWKVEGGFLEVVPGTGDLLTVQRFRDFFLHIEFRCPEMPRAPKAERSNSGVYLQGRYELQILDSWGVKKPGTGDCGALYGVAPPLTNASKPPAAWQLFEVVFRMARSHNGVIDPARVTLLHNGLVVHNNVPIPAPTPGTLDDKVLEEGPLMLQDHGAPVAFRRIWIVPLAEG